MTHDLYDRWGQEYVHRDIKPENFLIGLGERRNATWHQNGPKRRKVSFLCIILFFDDLNALEIQGIATRPI